MSDLRERNKKLALDWITDCWDGNDETDGIMESMLLPDTVGFLEGVIVKGPLEFRAFRDEFIGAFNGLKVEVDGLVAESDWVAIRWRARGAQSSALRGIPPGKSIDVVGSTWLRFNEDGRIVEGHDTWSQGAVMAHLAGVPEAGYLEGARRRI